MPRRTRTQRKGRRITNMKNAKNARNECRLAVYEKLLSKTYPEDQKLVEERTEMLADAKAELEHYPRTLRP